MTYTWEKLAADNPELYIQDGDRLTRELPTLPDTDTKRQIEEAQNGKRLDATARLRGATSKSSGAAFQAELDIYHAALYRDGLAMVHRTDPPIRYAGDGKWYVIGQGPVDYIAFLAGGRMVVFDAKVRAGDAFSVGTDEMHQLAWLKDAARLGHAAGYVVRWGDYDVVRWHGVASVDGKRVRMADGAECDGCKWLDCTV